MAHMFCNAVDMWSHARMEIGLTVGTAQRKCHSTCGIGRKVKSDGIQQLFSDRVSDISDATDSADESAEQSDMGARRSRSEELSCRSESDSDSMG